MALNPALASLIKAQAAKYQGNSGDVKKLKEGRNVVRVVAPAVGTADWVTEENPLPFRDYGVHWIKTAKNAKPLAVVGSEEICYGRPSALGAAVEAAYANAFDDESKELFAEWRATKRVLVNLLNRDEGDAVEVYELTPTTWGKVLNIYGMWVDMGVDIFDANTGMDLVITRTGKGLNTNYDVQVVPLPPGTTCKALTPQQLAAAKNLDAFIASNFFRPGDEAKALASIGQITGLALTGLSAPASPTAALAAPKVADAPVAAPVTPVAPPVAAPVAAPAPTAAAVPPAGIDPAVLAAAQEMIRQQQAAAAASAPPVAPAPVAAPVTIDAATTTADLDVDEQERLLNELNMIGG